jgi:hypothetical protein
MQSSKPKPRTIQFLLPTASPGEIELVYREIMSNIPEKRDILTTQSQFGQQHILGFNQAVKQFTAEVNKLFGKEG